MKIFISYGRDCFEFVKKLRDDLTGRGYDVWMDLVQIHPGSDWRYETANGIIKSQAVLVFLSAHSLRPDSVCWDEITISAACRRHIIRPVIMEKGIENRIPPVLSERQYFDLSDWRSKMQDENWYRTVTDPLIAELSRMEKDPFDSQMDVLQKALQPFIMRTRFLRELEKPYCERTWLDECIGSWLDHRKTGPLLLIGFPGSGKSNYFSHYCQFSPNVVSLILCEWNRSGEENVRQTIRNISYQIAEKIDSFRNRLLWSINTGNESIHSMTTETLFDRLIVEPFSYEIDGNREPLLIVLDGLDAMSVPGEISGNELARLISERGSLLPEFVNFAIASRKDSAVLRYHSSAHIIELLPNDKNVRKDIENYLKGQLGAAAGDRSFQNFISRITDICEGSFLLAWLISSGIKEGAITQDETRLPPDIHSIYFEWVSRLVSEKEFSEKYYSAFAVLASIKKPVSYKLLQKALGWREKKLNAFIRRFKTFLTEERDPFDDKCISLYHRSFREWLTDEDAAADAYMVSAEDGHQLIGAAAFELWKKGRLPEGEIPYLPSYLQLADMSDERDLLLSQEEYLRTLMEIAGKAFNDLRDYRLANQILARCEKICHEYLKTPYAEYVRDAEIPLIRASVYFDGGDFLYVKEILSQAYPGIVSTGHPTDIMQCLYMLGTACDLLGERRKSVEYLTKLKETAEEEKDTFYRNRSLIGLAWNKHFSNVKTMNAMLSDLEHALTGKTKRERSLLCLVTARVLLSRGELSKALSLFSEALNSAESDIWGYSHLAVRSQMLLIESLTACYDNEEFELGIRQGKDIYKHLEGNGSIAECYCASWLAMNYLADGMTGQAEEYLARAEKVNLEANGSPSSAWMNMHLTSIKGAILEEKGDYKDAFLCHKKVEEMAVKCADPWVRGDALFEMLRLIPQGICISRTEAIRLLKDLKEVAASSGLPHLSFKSSLAAAFTEPGVTEAQLMDLLRVIKKNSLAATDMVACAEMCLQIASRENKKQLKQTLREFIEKEIDHIARKNPDGSYRDRPQIRRTRESLQA